ncbi:MAG TPA: MBL fold metallo-hydrolase [Acetobacteraceae bacterium]|nr:MBL fold metallo-hydrolase [Acetobacteraceae bacterium]
MPFLTEPEPERGQALECLPGISRIVARNPGPMTCFGTNTYLIDTSQGLVVLDPGPEDATHVRDIIAAAGSRRIRAILLSHTHHDHLGAVPALREAADAPVCAFHRPAAAGFTPDHDLADGDKVMGLTALHTPGHASDHLCFAHDVPGTGPVLFSGDHVMSWSSSVINPPDGDMRAYFASLTRLLERGDTVHLPGHGPLLRDPQALVREMLAHRQAREAAILAVIQAAPSLIPAIADSLYAGLDARLRPVAERNVLAHLLKLEAEGQAARRDELWQARDDGSE